MHKLKEKVEKGTKTNPTFEALYEQDLNIAKALSTTPSTYPYYHYHNYYELYYLFSGERYYFIEDKTYHIKTGSLVLIKPNVIHGTISYSKVGFDRILICFKKKFLAEILPILSDTDIFKCFNEGIHVIPLESDVQNYIEFSINNILKEYNEAKTGWESYIKFALSQLILYISRHVKRPDSYEPIYINSTHKIISEITAYINNNFNEDITLNAVSDMFHISPCYCSRTFKKLVGFSFSEYINNVRIKEARKLLAKTDMSVSEIAYQIGFNSSTHFGRIFKNIVGISPLEYRKRSK